MTQRTSLSELIAQSKRISKEIDLLCCSTIDSILEALPYIDKGLITKNREFFNRFCGYYHKDNPLDFIGKIAKKDRPICFSCKEGKDGCVKAFREFIESSLSRCERGLHASKILFCEIVDLLWERPEICSAPLIESDSYVQGRINEVCQEFNKQNPLTDREHYARLGKKWWDEENQEWQLERRKRF